MQQQEQREGGDEVVVLLTAIFLGVVRLTIHHNVSVESTVPGGISAFGVETFGGNFSAFVTATEGSCAE